MYRYVHRRPPRNYSRFPFRPPLTADSSTSEDTIGNQQGPPMSIRVPRRNAVLMLRQLLICQQPFAYCDACLAFHLDVSPSEANTAALALSREPGYARER